MEGLCHPNEEFRAMGTAPDSARSGRRMKAAARGSRIVAEDRYRRGRLTEDDLDAQVDEIGKEEGALKAQLPNWMARALTGRSLHSPHTELESGRLTYNRPGRPAVLDRRHDSRRRRIFRAILVLPLTGLLVSADPYAADRERMVREQIENRGIHGAELLRVLRTTPRHLFVPIASRSMAYADHPVPIGYEATISQPYIVALMTELLAPRKTNRVLEIGTGSGYQAAVLSQLARQVYTIEIVPELAKSAQRILSDLGYGNVTVRQGDGYKGWPEQAPFDGIMVTAAPPEVPQALPRMPR